MNRQIETSVLIVGAGPVGLTLAIDLAWRGVDVAVAELRTAGEPPNVKCNQVSARSMEIFRRLGLATRSATLACLRSTATTFPVASPRLDKSSLASRCRRGRGRARGEQGDDSWWPTPEPSHRRGEPVTNIAAR
jgi:2-polyprenyl-6-methoxyphenol hydroxylase-like FAD-dependent oxidoreductase